MHNNPFGLLGGALSGTLPNPSLVTDEAGLSIAARVFGPRPATRDVRAGLNITVTQDAGGFVIAGPIMPESLEEAFLDLEWKFQMLLASYVDTLGTLPEGLEEDYESALNAQGERVWR